MMVFLFVPLTALPGFRVFVAEVTQFSWKIKYKPLEEALLENVCTDHVFAKPMSFGKFRKAAGKSVVAPNSKLNSNTYKDYGARKPLLFA